MYASFIPEHQSRSGAQPHHRYHKLALSDQLTVRPAAGLGLVEMVSCCTCLSVLDRLELLGAVPRWEGVHLADDLLALHV
jgi:hypothetical protein